MTKTARPDHISQSIAVREKFYIFFNRKLPRRMAEEEKLSLLSRIPQRENFPVAQVWKLNYWKS